jgi:hypothetical protein
MFTLWKVLVNWWYCLIIDYVISFDEKNLKLHFRNIHISFVIILLKTILQSHTTFIIYDNFLYFKGVLDTNDEMTIFYIKPFFSFLAFKNYEWWKAVALELLSFSHKKVKFKRFFLRLKFMAWSVHLMDLVVTSSSLFVWCILWYWISESSSP